MLSKNISKEITFNGTINDKVFSLVKLSVITATILLSTGCSLKSNQSLDNPQIKGEEIIDAKQLKSRGMNIEDVILDKNALAEANDGRYNNVYLKPSEILMKGNEEIPFQLKSQKINNVVFTAKNFGSVINLLLTDSNVNLIIEPDVDLALPVTIKLNDIDKFEALKLIAASVGYNIYYENKNNKLVISPFKMIKFRIPSNILIGAESDEGELKLKMKKPDEELLKAIDKLGSDDKTVNLDKDSGMLFIKEHSSFCKEIEDYVVDFVLDRQRQFILELALIEIDDGVDSSQGINAINIQKALNTKGDASVLKINSLNGNMASVDSTGKPIVPNSGFTLSLNNPASALGQLGFDAFLNLALSNTKSKVVYKPTIVFNNHTTRSMNSQKELSYLASYKADAGGSTIGTAIKVPVIEKAPTGFKFTGRIDAHKYNDIIGVSINPAIEATELDRSIGSGDSFIQFTKKASSKLENTVNLQDGDIIVLNGLKYASVVNNETSNPLLNNIPFIGKIFRSNDDKSTNTNFSVIVKVKEVQNFRDTLKNIKSEQIKALNMVN